MADTYVVEREQRIEGPPAAVFERIVDFRRWQSWSPWEETDPGLWRGYSGAPSGVGALYEWAGNRKAGAGRMTITAVQPDESVTIDLQFLKPFKSKGTVVLTLRPEGTATVVRWTMTGRQTLMIRFFGIFMSMDKIIGPDFEKGLARLKADVETT
ncbi:MAG: SRPBCC family protein [Acidimicrobiia bacterium]